MLPDANRLLPCTCLMHSFRTEWKNHGRGRPLESWLVWVLDRNSKLHTCYTFTLCALVWEQYVSLHCVKRVLSSWRQLNGKIEIMTIDWVVHKLFRMWFQGEVYYLSNKWVDINLSEHDSAINLLLSLLPFLSYSLCAILTSSGKKNGHLSQITSFTINQVLWCELHWVCSKQEVNKTFERHNFVSHTPPPTPLLICLCWTSWFGSQ